MEKLLKSCFASKLKAAATIIGLLTGLFGVVSGAYTGLAWVDSRYAHAADVEQRFTWIQKQQLASQRQQYEDKVFELSLTSKKTPAIQALIDRYNERIRAIDEQLATMVKSQSNPAPSR